MYDWRLYRMIGVFFFVEMPVYLYLSWSYVFLVKCTNSIVAIIDNSTLPNCTKRSTLNTPLKITQPT